MAFRLCMQYVCVLFLVLLLFVLQAYTLCCSADVPETNEEVQRESSVGPEGSPEISRVRYFHHAFALVIFFELEDRMPPCTQTVKPFHAVLQPL